MLRKSFVFFSILSLFAVSLVSLAVAQQNSNANNQRVIVTFDEPVNESARTAVENQGGQVLNTLSLVNGLVVLLPEQALERVGALEGVRAVEPDVQVYALHHREGHSGGPGGGSDDPEPDPEPNPSQTLEWGVDRIDADLVWALSTGAGVNVAIVDTGIDLDHPDLNVVKGVDCTKGPNCGKGGSGDDDNGHGTHVAGIVGASNNTIGVVGVAPNVNLHAVKVLNSQGSGFLSDVIEGIEWSVNNGMNVVNMSLGTSSDIQAMRDAVDAANAAGVVIVAAAGNEGDSGNAPNYPAAYNSVIAVSATDFSDSVAYFSNTGSYVEVAAPGVDVRSTVPGGGYDTFSGTSMASPHVAGAVALLLSNGVSASDVRLTLQTSAEDLGTAGFDYEYGYGLIDVEAALAL